MPDPFGWLRGKLDRPRDGEIGPDRFPLEPDDPLAEEHQLISRLLEEEQSREIYHTTSMYTWNEKFSFDRTTAGQEIARLPPEALIGVTLAMADRDRRAFACYEEFRDSQVRLDVVARHKREIRVRARWRVTGAALDALLKKRLPFEAEDLAYLAARQAAYIEEAWGAPRPGVIAACERYAKAAEVPDILCDALEALHAAAVGNGNDHEPVWRKFVARIEELLGTAPDLRVTPGEVWGDTAITEIAALSPDLRDGWRDLVEHAATATGTKPSKRWANTARAHLDRIGPAAFDDCVARWFCLVDRRPAVPVNLRGIHAMDPHNADVLKGLVWCCALRDEPGADVARGLGALALSSFGSVPGWGARCRRLGNACILALGGFPGVAGVGQLALLKIRLRNRSTRAAVDKALTATAERVGLPAEELVEMAVPTYGLTEVGRLTETLGEFEATLQVTGTSSTSLTWRGPGGKAPKSVPAAVKRDFADELKELKAAAKDIQKMIPAQRDRIDSLFLERKEWPYATWRERYLDHALVGTLARRIIWRFTSQDTDIDGMFLGDRLVTVEDEPIDGLGEDTTVRLWHPIDASVDEVLAWREWLMRHEVTQPFKQAHREVYLLTDAERETGTYSNRFAAHIVRQHQFHALCGVRGWDSTLQLLVDQEFPPPTRRLDVWRLRAEFWADGVGDDWQTDTLENMTFRFLATDQVRFYDSNGPVQDATGLPLEDIPPIVFSEVMRDADLFVGVASVGNDPAWADGGPEGAHRDYWESYSFGNLGATATTRRQFLERLVPRLKIADRCIVKGRFLVVRGDLRTYKIHLGSGNILMEPNDEYLCIVPGRGAVTGESARVFLPFEGDRTLSLILSKAFLLADDTSIRDATITSQIRH